VDGGVYQGDGSNCADLSCVRTLEVGSGKQFLTIQNAVTAAAALDDPSAPPNTPSADPIEIIIFEGIYEEGRIVIPPDPAQEENSANDGWTIRAATQTDTGKAFDDTVVLRGLFHILAGRDHMTFDGIHVIQPEPGFCDFGICDIGGTDTCVGGPRDGQPCEDVSFPATPFGPNADCGMCIGGPKAVCPDGRLGEVCLNTPGDVRLQCDNDRHCFGQDFAYQFVQDANNCIVRNALIFGVEDSQDTGGDNHGNAIYGNQLHGINTLEHLTLVNNVSGVQARDSSSNFLLKNSIIAFPVDGLDANDNANAGDALRSYTGECLSVPDIVNGNQINVEFSLIYSPPNLPPASQTVYEEPVNCYSNFLLGDCRSFCDLGGNINWPLEPSTCVFAEDAGGGGTCDGGPIDGGACGSDADCVGQAPMFISTDPLDENFLRLQPASPAVGSADSMGAYPDGQMNMGVFGSGPVVPGSLNGACCLPDASCVQVTIFSCAHQGGVWAGRGTPCSVVNFSVGSCCAINGVCAEGTEAECTGDFQGPASTCADSNCPFIQADPIFDRDLDGDVDASDFGAIQRCRTPGVSTPTIPPECEQLDVNGDGKIDEEDVQRFRACADTSGPAIPADVSCDD